MIYLTFGKVIHSGIGLLYYDNRSLDTILCLPVSGIAPARKPGYAWPCHVLWRFYYAIVFAKYFTGFYILTVA